MSFLSFLAVGLGSMAGGMCRYGISQALASKSLGFPLNTLLINLLGCLLIGLLAGLFERAAVASPVRLLCITGFLGGFTTFSTFSLESIQLFRVGNWQGAFAYIFISLIAGLGLSAAGFFLTRPQS